MALPLALLPLLCCLGGERLPALSTIRLISSSNPFNFFSLCSCVCSLCTRLSEHFSVIHSVVIVHGAGDIRLLFKLLFKFRNVLKHTESRSSLACNQNIKEDISTALEVFLCFETKRNDRNSPREHSRNARVISAEELGTMSKNNLRGITLDIGPILGIHSLTLKISCLGHNFVHFTVAALI